MNLIIYRTQLSGYQPKEFVQWERTKLEQLPEVQYALHINQVGPDSKCVVITNSNTQIHSFPEELWERTVLLIHPNSGHDNIPEEWIKKQNFPIVGGNPIRAHAVSEYILSALFEIFGKIPHHFHWDSERKWERDLLSEKNILILGYGHIGKLVARTLEALGCSITIFDPELFPDHKELNSAILSKSQVVIVACSLNQTSHHLLDQKKLEYLPDDVVIVNAARGGIIDENALKEILPQRPHWRVRLDVFEEEPFPPGFLEGHKQVNKSSHIAGVWNGINKKIIDYEFQVISDFIDLWDSNTKKFKQIYNEVLINKENLK